MRRTAITVGLAAIAIAAALVSGSSGAAGVGGEALQTSGRIAYSTYDSGAQAIHTSAPDGTDPRLIVRDGSEPVWSPDGRWIAYTHDYTSIRRVRADGTADRPIPIGGDWHVFHPAWSPDGRRLAFTRQWGVRVNGEFSARYGVYTTRRDGTGTRRLRFGTMPTWSPDGRLIAFSSGHGLAVIDPDGDRFRLLRSDVDPWFPAFAPNGRRLVFQDFNKRNSLTTLHVRTGQLKNIPEEALGGRAESPTWTPDGRRVAYLANVWGEEGGLTRVTGVELRTIRPDGTDRRRVGALPRAASAFSGLSWHLGED